ncbi:hemerythrin domain-containing protein [Ramlibacter sp.]|uniref:hemerythrin domain-containing protein n=1 Tax=Ramlibacter sp. TaxID=1917967 RepID=UPI002C243BB0|nr:hemerythrin domain-containing protein [Ramlibacter sp.]HWI84128.1 hemerythrin domain-containing protein [Ramlibacter sp.]
MNVDSRELNQVAAAAGRFDMYSGIHKAVRAAMADALLAVGRMDAEDDLALAQATECVMQLLDFCSAHLQHENEFVHAAIEARAAGASAAIAHEHEEHQRHIGQLAAAVGALRGAPASGRAPLAQALYRELALFIAANFEHMHQEETAHNTVLWARYSDAELVQLHDALIAAIPPQELMDTLRWLVPAMNPGERAALLGDIRAKAPAPAFQAIADAAQAQLRPAEWAKLARALGLAAAPGLVV